MKRIVVSMLVLTLMVSLLATVAMAATYEGGNANADFDRDYLYPNAEDIIENEELEDYPVTCYYYVGVPIFITSKASTRLSLASDAYGTAYATLWATSGEYVTSSNSTFDNGYIYSGYAKVTGNWYAKKVTHYAYRNHHIVEDWLLTFT